MKKIILSLIASTLTSFAFGQTSNEIQMSPAKKVNTENSEKDIWRTLIKNESPGQQKMGFIVPNTQNRTQENTQSTPATNTITPKIGVNFEAATPKLSPHDNHIAVGGNFIVSVMNQSVQFTDLNGQETYENSLGRFFDLGGYLIDPRVVFDPYEKKWIVGATDAMGAGMMLAFSDDEDPNGDWHTYKVRVGGGGLYDYPHLGVTDHQVIFSGYLVGQGACYAAQISKSDGYSGKTLRSKEYKVNGHWGTATVNVGREGSTFGNKAYLVGTEGVQGGQNINLFTFTDTIGGNPSLVKTVISADNYSLPSGGVQQKGGPNNFYVLGTKIYSALYMDGKIHLVTNVGHEGRYSIYYGIVDVQNETSATHYFNLPNTSVQFPSIASLTKDQVGMCFLETNSSKYPSVWVVFCDQDGNWSEAKQVKEGTGVLEEADGKVRWGDYSGTATGYGATQPTIWIAGEFGAAGKTDGRSSWIAEITADGLTTGTQNPRSDNNLETNVYPNPIAIDFFSVVFDLKKDEDLNISVFDINGRKIRTLHNGKILAGENKLVFNKKALKPGTYFLKITNETSELLVTKKLIVK